MLSMSGYGIEGKGKYDEIRARGLRSGRYNSAITPEEKKQLKRWGFIYDRYNHSYLLTNPNSATITAIEKVYNIEYITYFTVADKRQGAVAFS